MQRYNAVRDAIGNLARLAWGEVSREPIIQNADGSTGGSSQRSWNMTTTAMLDIRIVDTDAQSYLARPLLHVLLRVSMPVNIRCNTG